MRASRRDGRRRSRFSPQKNQRKAVATRQLDRLTQFAVLHNKRDPELATRYAELAWRMATRFNVKLAKSRILYCHHCKEFIVPPFGARFRLNKKRHALTVTCLKCGEISRKPLSLKTTTSPSIYIEPRTHPTLTKL